jgi:hypothetical protein
MHDIAEHLLVLLFHENDSMRVQISYNHLNFKQIQTLRQLFTYFSHLKNLPIVGGIIL